MMRSVTSLVASCGSALTACANFSRSDRIPATSNLSSARANQMAGAAGQKSGNLMFPDLLSVLTCCCCCCTSSPGPSIAAIISKKGLFGCQKFQGSPL